MVSRRTNFGERSELAPGRGGKLQSAGGGGGGRHKVNELRYPWTIAPGSKAATHCPVKIYLSPFPVVLYLLRSNSRRCSQKGEGIQSLLSRLRLSNDC